MSNSFFNMNIGFWRNTWSTISGQLRQQAKNPKIEQIDSMNTLWRLAGLDNLLTVWESAKNAKASGLATLSKLTLDYGMELQENPKALLSVGIISWWRGLDPSLTMGAAFFPMFSFEFSGTVQKIEVPEWFDKSPSDFRNGLLKLIDKENVIYPEPWWIAVLAYFEAFPDGGSQWDFIKLESRKLMDGHKLNNSSLKVLLAQLFENWPVGTFADQARILFQVDLMEKIWLDSMPLGGVDDKPLKDLLKALTNEQVDRAELMEISVKLQNAKEQWAGSSVGGLYAEVVEKLRFWLSHDISDDEKRLDLLNAVDALLQPQLAASKLEAHVQRLRGNQVKVEGDEGRIALREHIEGVFQTWSKMFEAEPPKEKQRAEVWVQQQVYLLQRWQSWAEFYAPNSSWLTAWENLVKHSEAIWRLHINSASPDSVRDAVKVGLEKLAGLSLAIPSPSDNMPGKVSEKEKSRPMVGSAVKEVSDQNESHDDLPEELSETVARTHGVEENGLDKASDIFGVGEAGSIHQKEAKTEIAADNVDFEEEFLAETRVAFFEEARDVLSQMQPYDEALLDLRRSFHTMKGSGRMAKIPEISEKALLVEEWLNDLRDAQFELLPSDRDVIAMIVVDFQEGVLEVESGRPWNWNFTPPVREAKEAAASYEDDVHVDSVDSEYSEAHSEANEWMEPRVDASNIVQVDSQAERPVAAKIEDDEDAIQKVEAQDLWQEVDDCLSIMLKQAQQLDMVLKKMLQASHH